MELARYKRCFLCNEVALWTKRFPPASRPVKQREWVLRLNKDDEETADLLNKHRQKKDPRWCERHFDKQIDDLPIDHRAVPARSLTLPTVPLRTTRPADLHPKAEHNSRLHESASWHERSETRSPRAPLSPLSYEDTLNPVWSTASLSLNDSIDVDSWNDTDEVVPKKFKSAVSTATMTTVEPEVSGL
ncbi:hypothetical protein PMAYCL1PPCAC_22225 [Pristionchus mayeri]|uniref:Uncharacterized protein n=1 Tax=Pristionchus mayeri TaxID=1317129 RepID=A0AAN5CE36_9BILA|nr:hypothetical protein PMAYCL1PPCAC_10427 [Pristionchus mayeri]GMR52029.1 hypothetical protein PMAYCL1PPCAC_22225 [Pristionchus mayeri]